MKVQALFKKAGGAPKKAAPKKAAPKKSLFGAKKAPKVAPKAPVRKMSSCE